MWYPRCVWGSDSGVCEKDTRTGGHGRCELRCPRTLARDHGMLWCTTCYRLGHSGRYKSWSTDELSTGRRSVNDRIVCVCWCDRRCCAGSCRRMQGTGNKKGMLRVVVRREKWGCRRFKSRGNGKECGRWDFINLCCNTVQYRGTGLEWRL